MTIAYEFHNLITIFLSWQSIILSVLFDGWNILFVTYNLQQHRKRTQMLLVSCDDIFLNRFIICHCLCKMNSNNSEIKWQIIVQSIKKRIFQGNNQNLTSQINYVFKNVIFRFVTVIFADRLNVWVSLMRS